MKSYYISSNLNLSLKLFFYSSILANNNLLLKIYCKNIVVAFLNCHFFFFSFFFPFLISSIRFILSTHFFKYTFQQILYHLLHLIYYFFHSLFFLIIIYSSYIYSQQLYFSIKSVISTTFFAILSHESYQNLM